MQEVINSINQAEQRAAEISAQALQKATDIASAAEARTNEIAKLSEAECKALREKGVKAAEIEAETRYSSYITEQRAKAAQYAAECLKTTDGTVNAIVRRITRGDC